jgi:hypothetical protein
MKETVFGLENRKEKVSLRITDDDRFFCSTSYLCPGILTSTSKDLYVSRS